MMKKMPLETDSLSACRYRCDDGKIACVEGDGYTYPLPCPICEDLENV